MGIYDDYPDGIKGYETFYVTKSVYFPKNDVKCKFCRFCIYDRNRGGYTCVLTDEILYAIDKGVGIGCPLEKEGAREEDGI